MKHTLIAALAANVLAFTGSAASAAAIYNFTPLAGQEAILDHTDGTATAARFFNPVRVAVDLAGNVYVADSGDHTVRRIDTSGNASVWAGSSGTPGNADGNGTSARFGYPYGIAVGADNAVYVTDTLNNNVRKIAPDRTVTTLATGFNGPEGVAVDPSNNVYVSDTNNSSIKKITPAGAVSLFAGSITNAPGTADGAGTAASFNFPQGLATDSAGNIYVADFDNSAIRMITPAGVVSTIAGTIGNPGHANGTGTGASFDHPTDIAVDSAGNVYVVDTSNQLVREIAATTHVVTTVAGTYDTLNNRGVIGKADGAVATATFFYPQGIAVTGAGTIYIADTGNHSVRTISGGAVSTDAGSVGVAGSANGAAASATFKAPYGVAVDGAGNVYIADAGNNLIRKLSGGTVSTLAGTANVAGATNAQGTLATFNNPSGVAVDRSGTVYVADTGNNLIRKITSGGLVSTFATGFNGPQGIAVDAAGNVYVADTNNSVISKITTLGAVTTLAGSAGNTGSSDAALGANARFNKPNAVAVDSAGNVYVSDFGNSVVRKIAATTTAVSTLAGAVGQIGLADGSTSSARFNQTYGIAVDSSGNVYVTDTLNRVVRQITATGVVTTVTGTMARFFYPEGIAADSSNNLYVVDADNNSVSEGAAVSNLNTGLANHTVPVGGTATFAILPPDSTAAYQWQYSTNGGIYWNNVANGSGYSGSTTSALTIAGATAGMSGYEYRAVATNSLGTSTSPAGTLYVGNVRLLNLSSSGFVGTTGNDLVAGFVISGTGAKNILLRGIGPTLAAFGVTGVLAQPSLTLFTGANPPTVQASNTIWGGGAVLANAMAAVGAFTLPAASADSALYMSASTATALSAGSHTAHVSSASTATGEALVEVYDADIGTPSARLSNISTLAPVGPVNLVAGFVIGGTTSETVLIRGVGPGLAPLGVANPLPNVMLTVYDKNQTVIASNNGWSTTSQAQLTATFTQVGAFTLTPGSADSALLVTLAPGSYTAIVTGINGATGTALVEIYEVP